MKKRSLLGILVILLSVGMLLTSCLEPETGSGKNDPDVVKDERDKDSDKQDSKDDNKNSDIQDQVVNDTDPNSEFGNFVTKDLNGDTFSSVDLSGHKVNLINVWATFCGPCIREMPDLEKIAGKYAPDLQVIGICLDVIDEYGQTDDYMIELAKQITDEETHVTYTSIIPPRELLEGVLADVNAVPTSYIVDGTGKVLESFVGSRSEEDFETILGKYLGQ